MAGHGTFIAGVVRQYCASTELVIVPVMYGDGAADETDLIDSLEKLLVWNRLRKEDQRLDVLTLSLGYYHETPGSVDDEAGLFAALRQLQRDGVCIVAAAGNGATAMEFWPAALATQSVRDEHGKEVPAAPLVSVGATNPSDDTVAAFSNTGSWVTHYRCGVARGQHDADEPRRFAALGVARPRPPRHAGTQHLQPRRLLHRVRGVERQLVLRSGPGRAGGSGSA